MMNRLVIVARLRDGSHERALDLIRTGPPFSPDEQGLSSHGVYLTSTDVVFVFEASAVEWIVNDIVNDPVIAAAFAPWHALVDGPPRIAHEHYFWSRDSGDSRVELTF
jgi:hypothetical protein